MKQKLTEPNEDYLERIVELTQKKGYARVSDIAEVLGVSKPSVTNMLQKLSERGYVKIERYRGLTLTEKGKEVGSIISKRHQILSEFFTLLSIPSHIKEKDIEGIEHHLSKGTVSALESLVKKLKKN